VTGNARGIFGLQNQNLPHQKYLKRYVTRKDLFPVKRKEEKSGDCFGGTLLELAAQV